MQYSIYREGEIVKRNLLAVIILSLFASVLFSQVSDKVVRVNVGTAKLSEPLSIQIDLAQTISLDRIEIAYRQFGARDFRRSEMSISGNIASITLPAEIIRPPFLEYYFVLYIVGKAVPETYPLENAEQQPLKINFQTNIPRENDLVILSPEENEVLRANDVLVSFSLSSSDSTTNKSGTKIYLDDVDITMFAVKSGDLYVVKPENLSLPISSGNHTVTVDLLDSLQTVVKTYKWQFSVTAASDGQTSSDRSPWSYNSTVLIETRSENIANNVTPYNRASIYASGAYHKFIIKGNLYFTNEEKDNRQPQNRYFIGGESPWLKIGYGDSYPVFSDLIMNGKRVRGITGNLTLGKFNLDIVSGTIIRRIESDTVMTFPRDSLFARQREDSTAAYGIYKDSTWAKYQHGTFSRDIIVVRPSFGKRDESHLGFTYLKSKDDIGSIKFGVRPQENMVIGSDLLLTFDSRNFEISGQVAFSATNRDISKGTFSDETIDSLFRDPTYNSSDRKNISDIRNIVSRFITVNEYLIPLRMKNLPTLSYEGGLSLNYFKNSFRLTYLRHGDSYESFGQSYLRTDVAGFNISDQFRLMNNQLFLTGGFEQLRDNTAKTKASTTAAITSNIGISYFPMSNFPSITLAYLHASNSNDLENNDTLYAVNDQADRFFIQLGKKYTFGIRHNASLNVGLSSRDDRTVKDLDTRNTSVNISNISTFNIPLQTMISLTINASKFVSLDTSFVHTATTFSYSTVYMNAQYQLLEGKLQLVGTFSPTFGDVQRVLINASAQYYFSKYLNAQAQMNLYLNQKLYRQTNVNNDIIWSLTINAHV